MEKAMPHTHPTVSNALLKDVRGILEEVAFMTAYLLPVSTKVTITLKQGRDTGVVYAEVTPELSGLVSTTNEFPE